MIRLVVWLITRPIAWVRGLPDSSFAEIELILTLIDRTERDEILWQNEGQITSDLRFSSYMIKDISGMLDIDNRFIVEVSFGKKATLSMEGDSSPGRSLISRREETKDLILAIFEQLRRSNPDEEFAAILSQFSNS